MKSKFVLVSLIPILILLTSCKLDVDSDPTSTPTLTDTATPTFTSTPTATQTPTATFTSNPTATQTFTPTATNTPVPPTKKSGNGGDVTLCPDGTKPDPISGCDYQP